MTQMAKGHTWEEMGVKDPAEGVRQLIEGIRKMQELP
jgi:hypothetical protein